MDNKEAFAVVKKHLLCQRKRSKGDAPGPMCKYYGSDGLKCAVGCLIPVEEYHPQWDQTPTRVIDLVKIVPALRGLDVEMLRNLQAIHDTSPIEAWESHLNVAEKRYGQ